MTSSTRSTRPAPDRTARSGPGTAPTPTTTTATRPAGCSRARAAPVNRQRSAGRSNGTPRTGSPASRKATTTPTIRYSAEGRPCDGTRPRRDTWFVNEHWRTVNDGHRYANVFLGEQMVASHRTSSADSASAAVHRHRGVPVRLRLRHRLRRVGGIRMQPGDPRVRPGDQHLPAQGKPHDPLPAPRPAGQPPGGDRRGRQGVPVRRLPAERATVGRGSSARSRTRRTCSPAGGPTPPTTS